MGIGKSILYREMPDSERRSGLPGGEQREAGLGQNESPGADIIRAGAQGKTDSFGHPDIRMTSFSPKINTCLTLNNRRRNHGAGGGAKCSLYAASPGV
jgi:hypothetical protein